MRLNTIIIAHLGFIRQYHSMHLDKRKPPRALSDPRGLLGSGFSFDMRLTRKA